VASSLGAQTASTRPPDRATGRSAEDGAGKALATRRRPESAAAFLTGVAQALGRDLGVDRWG
jgi:hypothetical protein